jgi:hypothetical protein
MSEEILNEEVIVEEQGEIPAPLILEVDAALLVGEFLKDKEVSDEDSLNLELFLKGDLSGWRFKNVPAPTMEELKALESAVSSKLDQEKVNAEAQAFLDASDFKVLRHRDQQDMGLATSLSGEEFQELLQQRQMAREAIIK